MATDEYGVEIDDEELDPTGGISAGMMAPVPNIDAANREEYGAKLKAMNDYYQGQESSTLKDLYRDEPLSGGQVGATLLTTLLPALIGAAMNGGRGAAAGAEAGAAGSGYMLKNFQAENDKDAKRQLLQFNAAKDAQKQVATMQNQNQLAGYAHDDRMEEARVRAAGGGSQGGRVPITPKDYVGMNIEYGKTHQDAEGKPLPMPEGMTYDGYELAQRENRGGDIQGRDDRKYGVKVIEQENKLAGNTVGRFVPKDPTKPPPEHALNKALDLSADIAPMLDNTIPKLRAAFKSGNVAAMEYWSKRAIVATKNKVDHSGASFTALEEVLAKAAQPPVAHITDLDGTAKAMVLWMRGGDPMSTIDMFEDDVRSSWAAEMDALGYKPGRDAGDFIASNSIRRADPNSAPPPAAPVDPSIRTSATGIKFRINKPG